MKKMILAFLVLSLGQAYGQDIGTRFSIAANAGVPTNSGMTFAYGLDVQTDFPITSSFKFTASAGYEAYSLKGQSKSFQIVPILLGGKFNFGESNAYGHAQLGYSRWINEGGGAFAFAPSIGYYFNSKLDGSIKYLAYYSGGAIGSINLRLAYNF